MSIRLRPMGKPCLRSPRGALLAVAGVVALTTAPATAAYADHVRPLGWYAEEAAVPAAVQFEDVAATGDTALAVGREVDPITLAKTAVVYTRAGGGWQRESLTVAADTELVDVEFAAGGVAWAVGRSGGNPLVLRRSETGSWNDASAALPPDGDADPDAATAVAVAGETVLVGDDEGQLHRVPAGGATTPSQTTTMTAAGAADINGIELFSNAPGYAVASSEAAVGDGNARIYEVGTAPILEPAMTAPGDRFDMRSLAATQPYQAVALDSENRTWRVNDDAAWEVEGLSGLTASRQLFALASVAGGDPTKISAASGWGTEFLVGVAPPPSDPESTALETTIWHRTRWGYQPANWTRAEVPAGTPALRGVTAVKWDDAWAVGDNGAIVHYWRPPDPEAHAAAEQAEADRRAAEQAEADRLAAERAAAEQAEADRLAAEQAAAEQAEADRLAAEQAAAEQAAAEQAAAEQAEAESSSSPPPPPPPAEQDDIRMNGVIIDDSPATRPDGSRRPRLLKDVKAIRRGQKLIVSFRLTARARVALVAKRSRRVIARTRMRTFRKGRRSIVLRFRGRPPSSLKVVVRRVSGARDNR